MKDKLRRAFDSIQGDVYEQSTRHFLEEKTRGYTVIHYRRKRYPAILAAAACFLLMLGGNWLNFIPTAQISIEINPSIQLDINRFDRIISVEGLNEDGERLAKQLKIQFLEYNEGISRVMQNQEIAALLSDNEILSIGVIGDLGMQYERILSGVAQCTAQQPNADCYGANWEQAEAAGELGISCGKYRYYLELVELGSEITPEQLQGMSMREIRDSIAALESGQSQPQSAEGDQGSQNQLFPHQGHGHGGMGKGHRYANNAPQPQG